jgi:hypothetical protein
MKLYKTFGERPDHTLETKWSGTQADARADRKQLKETGKLYIETTEADIPTDKTGLLAWLNKNVS